MSDLRKIHVGETIYGNESCDLISKINTLISRSNTLCAVEKAVNESNEILDLCNNIMKEMEEAGNASVAVMLALTIEAANSKIKELKQENDELYQELSNKR